MNQSLQHNRKFLGNPPTLRKLKIHFQNRYANGPGTARCSARWPEVPNCAKKGANNISIVVPLSKVSLLKHFI